ncbi:hypothetical protein LZG04_32925 [Saccharothrix sp. S26]|uniref:hypothetical protein n=1 Tax=Saccharothrix sp. S26 TaxID=2907215 RepID=UPI001F4409FF|nr:hypothetical protein [Saccharothrix sp. S26]MCE6999582.1 hypothetical protein [Saccharothrix sp. S26]
MSVLGSAEPADGTEGESPLDAYVADIINKTVGGEPAGHSTAPIVMPAREELVVRLVTQHSLDRLRDAEADRTLFDSVLWSLVGAVLGFFTNVITGDDPVSTAGYVLLAMLVVAFAGVVLVRIRLARRLRSARNKVNP